MAQLTRPSREIRPERKQPQDPIQAELSKATIAQAPAKKGTTSTIVPSSMMAYIWSTSTSKWVLPPTLHKYIYDSKGSLQQEIIADSSATQPASRYSYSYNSNGSASTYLEETWTGTAWRNASRSVFSYDSRGYETEWLRQKWVNGAWENESRDISNYSSLETELLRQDWVNGVWQNKSRLAYFFNTQGRYTGDVYQEWDGNMIVYGYRTSFTYNANGAITQQISESWDKNRNDFILTYRYSYIYNAAGGRIEEVGEDWNIVTNSFVPSRRYIYTVVAAQPWSEYVLQVWQNGTYVNAWRTINPIRDAEGRLTRYESQRWYSTIWQDEERTTISYQANGSYEQLIEKYVNGEWTNSLRYSDINQEEGVFLENKSETWNGNSWKIFYGRRLVLNYDAAGNIKRRVDQEYSTADEKYINTKLYTYGNYQTITLANQRAAALTAATQVYPNPTAGKATLQLAGLPQGQGVLQGQLLNTLGQVVQQFTLKLQQGTVNQELDLSQLKAGVYTLRIQTKEGAIVKQVVRQ
ncbi:hypothetical protein BXP70_18385 [Hymenobacter crusticola]|uniref:Secretion system C-terminal sorting domain-containing protein n=2 Tax=Hymenobacter crusticola TaxID=1770526 RepID=A0A243WAG0_9BACT|nr:hypothetical protein BXP70_18385 [Hymenobacter crusticola]